MSYTLKLDENMLLSKGSTTPTPYEVVMADNMKDLEKRKPQDVKKVENSEINVIMISVIAAVVFAVLFVLARKQRVPR